MLFNIFPILFTIMFVFIFGMFIVQAVRGIGQWSKNNASPVLTVEAKVVSKRESHHHHHNSDGVDHTSFSYYVTFEVESGDRMELSVSGREYGMLVEGDYGKLTFQGTRYHGFERSRTGRHDF